MNKVGVNANDILKWCEAPSVKGREALFKLEDVFCDQVLKSWRLSLFSHEWLDSKGQILPLSKMIEKEKKKRENVLMQLKNGKSLQYPVLGLGLNDNVEIGAGRDVFLTLAAEGYKKLPVYIPISCIGEFKEFLA